MLSQPNLVKINNLSFEYKKDSPIFKDLSLEIPVGSFSLFHGPSGCGKSTLLKIIAKIYPNFGGKIIHGDIHTPQSWGMVFQDPDKQFTMENVRQEMIFALENLNFDKQEAENRMKLAIQKTKIADFLDTNFNLLSGGEKQRAALAVIIAMNPDLILLDEPFASCDQETRLFLLDLLKDLKQEGLTIIVSDHDLNGYKELVDQVYLFKDNFHLLDSDNMNSFFKQKENYSFSFDLPNEKSLLQANDFSLSAGKKLLIKNSNFQIYPGITLLTGNNGTGKSSLFKSLTKLIPYNGSLVFEKKEVSKWKSQKYLRHVGQVFQNPDQQFFMVTLKEELDIGLKHSNNPRINENNINSIIKELGLAGKEEQVVYSLSGGQKKKLQLLLMILANPQVLLLDEPFAGVDHQSSKQLLDLLTNYYLDSNKSLVLISHQFSILEGFCNYHLHLANKELRYLSSLEVHYES